MPDHSTIGAAPQLQIASLIPKVASFVTHLKKRNEGPYSRQQLSPGQHVI